MIYGDLLIKGFYLFRKILARWQQLTMWLCFDSFGLLA